MKKALAPSDGELWIDGENISHIQAVTITKLHAVQLIIIVRLIKHKYTL